MRLKSMLGGLCLLATCLQAPAVFAVPAYLQANQIKTYAFADSKDGQMQLYVYCNRLGKLDTYFEVSVAPDSYLQVVQQFDKGPKTQESYVPEMNGGIMFLTQGKRPAFIEQVRKSKTLTMALEGQEHVIPLAGLNGKVRGFVCKLGG